MSCLTRSTVRRENASRLVMLDPNIRPVLATDPEYRSRLRSLIFESTIVKASAEDLAWLYPNIDYRAAAKRILDVGARLVLVTLGAAGAYGATRNAQLSVPAVPVEIVDTIGAGDAFGAATLAWLHDRDALDPRLSLSELDLESLLKFSCLAASLTCTRSGAEPPGDQRCTPGPSALAAGDGKARCDIWLSRRRNRCGPPIWAEFPQYCRPLFGLVHTSARALRLVSIDQSTGHAAHGPVERNRHRALLRHRDRRLRRSPFNRPPLVP